MTEPTVALLFDVEVVVELSEFVNVLLVDVLLIDVGMATWEVALSVTAALVLMAAAVAVDGSA